MEHVFHPFALTLDTGIFIANQTHKNKNKDLENDLTTKGCVCLFLPNF